MTTANASMHLVNLHKSKQFGNFSFEAFSSLYESQYLDVPNPNPNPDTNLYMHILVTDKSNHAGHLGCHSNNSFIHSFICTSTRVPLRFASNWTLLSPCNYARTRGWNNTHLHWPNTNWYKKKNLHESKSCGLVHHNNSTGFMFSIPQPDSQCSWESGQISIMLWCNLHKQQQSTY